MAPTPPPDPRLPGLPGLAGLPTRRAVLLAGLALAATACIGSSDTGQEVRGAAERAPVDDALLAPTIGAVNTFALDLYRAMTDQGPNLVLAPVAVATALAMARAGATGDTRDQLDALLHAGDTPDLDGGLNAVGSLVRSRDGERRNDRRKGRVIPDQPASLWAPRGTRFTDGWLDVLARDYGQGPRVVDVVADPEAARDAVNRWGSDETDGHITELVRHGDISQYTRFLAATAGYLQAPWAREFPRDRTKPARFTFLDDTTADIPTMSVLDDGSIGFAEGDGWQAVELPYLGNELALVIFVPWKGRFTEFEQALTPARVGDLVDRLQVDAIDLRLPRFAFTTQADLGEILSSRLGAPAAFSARDADFSGITADEFLSLSGLAYQGFFSVSEEGTEGTAATVNEEQSVTGARRVAVDQPFIFLVRDRQTGLILHVGRVQRPR